MKENNHNPFIFSDGDIIRLIEGHNSKIDISELSELTCYGIKLLFYIYQNLENDFIQLRWKDVSANIGYGTYATFHKAIGELENLNLIRRKGRNKFWTNPEYLFRTGTDKVLMAEYYMNQFEMGMKKFAPKVYFEKFTQIRNYKKREEEIKNSLTNK